MNFEFEVDLDSVAPDIANELAARGSDPGGAIEIFSDACKTAYWDRKDIDRFIQISIAGIRYHSRLAENCSDLDAQLSRNLLGSVKRLAYNLGSFTWPGWDEPGIMLTDSHCKIGLDASIMNLHLARELGKGDLPIGRGCWLVGAQRMVTGEWETARTHFAEYELLARMVGSADESLLGKGYVAVVDHLQDRNNAAHIETLEAIYSRLAEHDNGKDFRSQLETAKNVFSR